MRSIFDALVRHDEKKSLSSETTVVYRVEHKHQEVGPYNFNPENAKERELRDKCRDWHSGCDEERRHPSWYFDDIEVEIYRRAGLLNATQRQIEAMRDWVSGFTSEKDIYVWFDGLVKRLENCKFVIRTYIVPNEDVIYGYSGKQIAFKIKHKHHVSTEPIHIERMEKVLGRMGEKIH